MGGRQADESIAAVCLPSPPYGIVLRLADSDFRVLKLARYISAGGNALQHSLLSFFAPGGSLGPEREGRYSTDLFRESG